MRKKLTEHFKSGPAVSKEVTVKAAECFITDVLISRAPSPFSTSCVLKHKTQMYLKGLNMVFLFLIINLI